MTDIQLCQRAAQTGTCWCWVRALVALCLQAAFAVEAKPSASTGLEYAHVGVSPLFFLGSLGELGLGRLWDEAFFPRGAMRAYCCGVVIRPTVACSDFQSVLVTCLLDGLLGLQFSPQYFGST